MGLLLIEDEVLYKEVINKGSGDFVDSVWIQEDDTITYEPFNGTWEPYQDGQEAILLPSGVSSSDAIILYTGEDLLVHTSLKEESSVADVIYLKNPEENSSATPYTVWSEAEWNANKGFKLIEDFNEILCIRDPRK